MIESKARNSGSFNQNAENITAPEVVDDDGKTHVKTPLLNTLFAGKYLILEVLGEGGMSVVYLARHEALNKLVAIKTLHTHLMSKTSSLMRFKQEAQAASRLQHPGIVAMHDYGITEDGTPYLVMDYLSGESLAELLHKIKSLPNADALNIFKQTTAAIAHAHERGVVHRDIKPSNIMLNFDEHNIVNVQIVDFGVAKLVESDEAAKLTQTGESLGSPLYMSPEQCLGQQLDVRSDIYSFGCVMYEALMGVPALASDSVFKTMMKHIHDMPASFKDIRPEAKNLAGLERIVFKALAKEPAKRYQRMVDVLADLNNLHEHQGIARNIIHKFELTGLRQTTKSLNFMVASSLMTGALMLFGTNFVLSTLSNVSTAPNLQAEAPVWSSYRDKMAISPSESESKQRGLGSLQNLIIESDEQAVRDANPIQFGTKQLELAFERRSKAAAERNLHHYDGAMSDYVASIDSINKHIDRTKDMERSNAYNNLMLAYIGKGDCEYFNAVPDYKSAGEDYTKAINIIRRLKNELIWMDLSTTDQLQVFLRNADCYFLQGDYNRASTAREAAFSMLRSVNKSIQDPNYKTLTDSKIAEEMFRKNKLQDAKSLYEVALQDWIKGGTNFDREQAIAAGRLAEINDLLDSNQPIDNNKKPDAYTRFDELASRMATFNPEKLRSQFFAAAYQRYAYYLWHRNDFAKSLRMHELSKKYSA
jgi:serine/threonine protein kinase